MLWIYQLPKDVQKEIEADARKILMDVGYKGEELEAELDWVMREKLANVIGYSDGELDAEKYGKWLFV